MKTPLLISLLSICILWSCEKDVQCPIEIDMGSFDLLPSTKDLYPYKDSVVNIIFRDSLNNEVVGTVTRIRQGFTTTSSRTNCSDRPELEISIRASTEVIDHFVSIPPLDIGFHVRFWAIPDFVNYKSAEVRDVANIIFQDSSLFGIGAAFPPQISLILDNRNYTGFMPATVVPEPIFTKLGKEFAEVYSNKIGLEEVSFQYNHVTGIVAFKLKPEGTWWVFERFE